MFTRPKVTTFNKTAFNYTILIVQLGRKQTNTVMAKENPADAYVEPTNKTF